MSRFEELSISLPDGYDAYARYWPAKPQIGSVLFIHGIQSHCGWYDASASALQDAGFAVLQPDRRGSGRNLRDRGHADSPGQLIDDAKACLDVLRHHTRRDRHHLVGVSWGGKLVGALHVQAPHSTESLVLITPGLFPVVGVSKSEMLRIGFSMVGAPHRLYDIPLNDPAMFTKIPERIEFLKNDELQIHQATAGFYLASRRMDKICAKMSEARSVPLHLMLAQDESIIDNEKTRQFVRSLHWPETAITTYLDSRHTLEFDPDRDRFFADLVSWISDTHGRQTPQANQ